MSWQHFLITVGLCALAIWICRIAPVLLLKDRELPKRLEQALNFIPPAAFAALVANDLINPAAWSGSLWLALIPWLAAAVVVLIAVKTRSLLWCCLSGVVCFGLLLLIPL
jgi:branched-subunit amino acid transport protein